MQRLSSVFLANLISQKRCVDCNFSKGEKKEYFRIEYPSTDGELKFAAKESREILLVADGWANYKSGRQKGIRFSMKRG